MPPELTDRPRASAAAPAGVAAIPNGGVLRSFPNARAERETETERERGEAYFFWRAAWQVGPDASVAAAATLERHVRKTGHPNHPRG